MNGNIAYIIKLMNLPPNQEEQLSELLREHAILPTSQRLQIASVLFARHQHLSADQVLEKANQLGKKVSKATVYNTLNLFASKGLVREVMVDSSKVFYDSNTEPHHHFYNEDTGALSDFPAAAVEFSSLPHLPEGTQKEDIEVVIRLRNNKAQS